MISVITPTWQRAQLLLARCIPSVQAQTVAVEHVIVSDGPDPYLRSLLEPLDAVYAELAEHPDDPCNFGAYSRNKGLEVATGELVAYLDDDNAFRPNHIEVLAAALEAGTADFGYSQMFRHGIGDVVGAEPPRHGSVDSSILMHHRGVPEKFGMWPTPSPYEVDWKVVESWLTNGATWVFVPEVTVDYYHNPR